MTFVGSVTSPRNATTIAESPTVRCVDSRTTKVGKVDIHYLTGGHGDPLVVIHGCGDGAKVWLQTAKELSKYYTVYVPDLPGFGHSQSMGDYCSLSSFVAFVDGFSHSLGLERFHLVGHSMGGCIALLYALKFPHKIERLTLVSSIGLGKEISLWIRALSSPVFGRIIKEAAIAITKAASRMIRFLHAPFQFINPVTRVRVDMVRTVTTWKGQATVLLGLLSELMMPTLLVWGDKDRIVPANHAYAAAELIPNCQVHIFEDAGHSVYKEKVQEFSQLLKRNGDFKERAR